tara:strand:+ start:1531 stop:2070 length:540 start_codon:yes stop_codon:yes gene_type:complete
MPRKAIDYSKGLCYKLVCLDPTIKEIYVGSTTDIIRRRQNHKGRCNNPNDKKYNLKVYQHIRAFGGWDNWKMVLIEKYSCENNLELGKREDYWKQYLKSSLNTYTPHIYETRKEYIKEYRKENRQQQLEWEKEYYQKNKEKILEQKKQKYTCKCGSILRIGEKARHEKSKKHLAYIEQK